MGRTVVASLVAAVGFGVSLLGPELLADAPDWVWGLIAAVTAVGGCLIVLTSDTTRRLLHRFRRPSMEILALVFLMCGSAGALAFQSLLWLRQDDRAERVLASNFIIEVDDVKVTRVQEDGTVEQPFPPPAPLVALVVSLRNTGDPSIAENFALSFSQGGAASVARGEYRPIPPGFELSPNERISPEDDLADKAFTRVERGAAIRGRLLFVFPSVTRSAFDINGSMLTLEFVDAWKTKYAAVITRTGTDSGFTVRQLPGLKR